MTDPYANHGINARREAARQRMQKREKHVRRMNGLFFTLVGLICLASLAVIVAVGFVAFHFIAKWW